MGKLVLTLITLLIIAAMIEAQCPASSKLTICSPKCIENVECSSMGGICCPNICNYKSCVLPGQFGSGNNDKYGANKNSGTGTYCGNTKCSPFEKCELDRFTKRMKCVRS